MFNRIYFIFTLLILAFIEGGNGLKCYECSSQRNIACDESLDVYKIDTATCKEKEVCYKVLKPGGENLEGVVIERGCSPSTYCHSLSIPCSTCDTDQCNSSTRTVLSFITVSIISFIYYLHYS